MQLASVYCFLLKKQRTQLTIDNPVETAELKKMTTESDARRNVARYLAIVAYLALLLMSGCGLAMDNEDRLARGEQAYTDGDFRAAIIDAKDVLLDEPNNLRGRLLLGRASVEVGDGPAAEKELQRAIGIGASEVDVAAEMARALLLQGRFERVLNEVPLEGLPSSTLR